MSCDLSITKQRPPPESKASSTLTVLQCTRTRMKKRLLRVSGQRTSLLALDESLPALHYCAAQWLQVENCECPCVSTQRHRRMGWTDPDGSRHPSNFSPRWELRNLTIAVEQLLEHSADDLPFTFFQKNGDETSPCSSILVTVKRQKRESSNSLVSRVPDLIAQPQNSEAN
jgi:hypothetical protein